MNVLARRWQTGIYRVPNKFVLSKGYPVSLTASLPDAPKATPADMATVSGKQARPRLSDGGSVLHAATREAIAVWVRNLLCPDGRRTGAEIRDSSGPAVNHYRPPPVPLYVARVHPPGIPHPRW